MRRTTVLPALALALAACGGPTDGARGGGSPSPVPSPIPSPTPATASSSPSPAPVCSAAGLPAQLPPQEGLPGPVQQTRQQLYEAAVACDLEALAALAPDQGFTHTFGASEDPAAHWRSAEQRGDAPTRYLAGVLRLPHGRQTVQGTTTYAWPEAFVHDRWSEVPERAREDLRTLYDQEALDRFAQFGSYAGYRVVVGDDGTWRAFVAGD